MTDRDDFAEFVASAKNATKCSSFYFNGRIRYGMKNERIEERFLCMDAARVFICSSKIPIKIESQFNILSIKLIEKLTDAHIIIETDEKQTHVLYGLHEKASLQPFLIILIRCLHAVFPHRLSAIVEIRPENEYDRLVRLSNEYYNEISNDNRPCGGFSLHYECACDFYQIQCYRSVQNLVDSVYAHRISREFTFRELETLTQKDWIPILAALRHNEWFAKLTIENIKLSTENIDEICAITRLCKTIKDLRLINCGLRQEFATKFSQSLIVSCIENLDLSNNALEDKGLLALTSAIQQRKLPLHSLNLQSCSITHKSLHGFHTALSSNNNLIKYLRIINLTGNRIKDENCIIQLFTNPENVLEELHLTDIEFSLESLFHSLLNLSCKLHRLYISPVKTLPPSTHSGSVKSFFTKIQTLEILQLSNANLSNEFLKELCDGLHSNIHLNKLDLRLSGNPLEIFVRDHAIRFATIPSLIALDITGCDLDNEIATLLFELKKNRKLREIYFGKNFNNIKTKNMQKTIHAMRELVTESNLEYLSIADSKLKENTADFLYSLLLNPSLKILDIRGNQMGDTGIRVLTHILQTNRHLHTIYFDRNMLSLNNFEEIINALEDNSIIEYIPIPITDIILMKITEKDRMEKIQYLINKLDTICNRNHQRKENLSPSNCLHVTTAANLTREMHYACDNQQQLFADQTSLEYILSCSNRTNKKNEEIHSILNRMNQVSKISSQLYDFYVNEEEQLKEEWNSMCKIFEGKLMERNERLSRKFYQLFKEQTTLNYDDKLQEQIRNYFSNSNDQIHHLLHTEMASRLAGFTRECYINVATTLRKRAYDTTNEIALDMHKQLETMMGQIPTPVISDGTHSSTSTLDRLVNRAANVVHHRANKHIHTPMETNEETTNNRAMKKADSNECLVEPSPKSNRLAATPSSKAPTSPKPPPPPTNYRRSVLVNSTEQDSTLINSDLNRINAKEFSIEDEADQIEHEILNIVEQEKMKEQHRNSPPTIPEKKRSTHVIQDNNLDLDVDSTSKLVHPSKFRVRPTKRQPRARRGTNGGSHDSSSDGGLDNDDDIPADSPAIYASETSQFNPLTITTSEPPMTELPPKVATKTLKPALKQPKTFGDESSQSATQVPPPVPAKIQLQARPSATQQATPSSLSRTHSMSKSMVSTNPDSPQIVNSDPTHEPIQAKSSMSASSYGALLSSNKDEQKDMNNCAENLSSTAPPVSARTGKIAIGTRVLPAMDPNGEVPQVKLRPLAVEKRAPPPTAVTVENESGDTPTTDDNEQYKRLSVKERARMLTTTIPPMSSVDKKNASPSNTTGSSSYTPRTHRRLIEQVNLFC